MAAVTRQVSSGWRSGTVMALRRSSVDPAQREVGLEDRAVAFAVLEVDHECVAGSGAMQPVGQVPVEER